MSAPLLTVVIATYNSSRILSEVLDSLKKQTISKRSVEVLVVDGGSTDNTRAIARTYGCRVIDNPRIVPAWAKFVGFNAAKGSYIMYLDSDEVIVGASSIARKLALFKKKNVLAVTGSGYRNPPQYSVLNQYVNEFGDPFSYFIYRLSKSETYYIPSMKSSYDVVSETNDHVIIRFGTQHELPIIELVAMGSMMHKTALCKMYPEITVTPDLIPHIFYLLVKHGAFLGIVKHDPLLHYSATAIAQYMRKIRSRIINNLFSPAGEGFQGRRTLSGTHELKKYLFMIYALTFIGPIFDAVSLCVTRRNSGYLVHIPLTLYTALSIMYYICMRTIGVRYRTNSYG